MKKTAFLTGVLCFLLTAAVNAQTDSTKTTTDNQQTLTTTSTARSNDRWNNWAPDKYKMLPMPAPMTTEQIFPVIGHYTLTSTDGAASDVTITLDESNKGVAWVTGLPQGK